MLRSVSAVELRLRADVIPASGHGRRTGSCSRGNWECAASTIGHIVTLTATAVATTLIANNAMKVNTTVSFTALPTPAGPPPTEMPL